MDFHLVYAMLAASDPPIQSWGLTGGAQIKRKGGRAMNKNQGTGSFVTLDTAAIEWSRPVSGQLGVEAAWEP